MYSIYYQVKLALIMCMGYDLSLSFNFVFHIIFSIFVLMSSELGKIAFKGLIVIIREQQYREY